MGLLKHFLFPCLAMINGMMAVHILILNDQIGMARIWLENVPHLLEQYSKEDSELTVLESHAIGAVGAFNAAFAFGFIMGILYEDSHFRGILLGMQCINYLLDSYNAYQHELAATGLYVLTAITWIGLIVHNCEPGIFTKDKNISTTRTIAKKKA